MRSARKPRRSVGALARLTHATRKPNEHAPQPHPNRCWTRRVSGQLALRMRQHPLVDTRIRLVAAQGVHTDDRLKPLGCLRH